MKISQVEQSLETCIQNEMMSALLKTVSLSFGEKVPNANYLGCKSVAARIISEKRDYAPDGDYSTNVERVVGNKVKGISTALKKKCQRTAYQAQMELFKDQFFGTTQLHEAIEYLVLAGMIESKEDAKHIRNFLRIMHTIDPEGVEDPRSKKQVRDVQYRKKKREQEIITSVTTNI